MNLNAKMTRTSKLFKTHREDAGVTQTEVADKLKLSSAQYISNFERNLCPMPAHTIRKVAKLINLPTKKILRAMVADAREALKKELE